MIEIRIAADTPRELGTIEGVLEIMFNHSKIPYRKALTDGAPFIADDKKYSQTITVENLPKPGKRR